MLSGAVTSCNEKTDENEDIAVTPSTVAVKEFHIQANPLILANLDSVFFSIDLTHRVIYNADSLPKGTDVTRLIPSITFMNSMSEVNLTYLKDDLKDTTVNYLTNPSDSINFTNPVKLSVVAADGINSYEYTIKVNVHNQLPDSLIWDRTANAALPSRLPGPVEQKTILADKAIYSLIKENNGTMTLAAVDDINFLPEAEGKEVEFEFTPQTESFTWAGDSFYILAADGTLYMSDDAITWISTGEKWTSIVGPYLGSIMGIKSNTEGLMQHCHFPDNPDISDSILESDFPITGRTSLGTIETEWAPDPVVIFTGGIDANGNVSNATWAFDGTVWTTISEHPTEPIYGATLLNYKAFRSKGKPFSETELDVWLLYGGCLEGGNFNNELFISLNNGITWTKASEFMQLPEEFPLLFGADGLVLSSTLEADLADNWTRIASKNPGRWMKISYEIEGENIYWDCPYIYIIGGHLPDGSLSDAMWRAVLARLTFTPLF